MENMDAVLEGIRLAESSQADDTRSLAEKALDTAAAVGSDVGMGVLEVPQAVVGGASTAVNEASDTAFSVARWLNENVADLGQLSLYGPDGFLDWEPGMPEENNLQIPEALVPDAPTTVTGNLARGISQFLTGYMIGGRALKAVGVPLQGMSVFARGSAQGAFSDAFFFDPHEQRLSNLVEQHPALSNPITSFLASDPNDSEALGRFKNSLEGLGIGALVEPLSVAIDSFRSAKLGDLDKAKAGLDQLEAMKGSQLDDALAGRAATDDLTALKKQIEAFRAKAGDVDPQTGKKPEWATRLADKAQEELDRLIKDQENQKTLKEGVSVRPNKLFEVTDEQRMKLSLGLADWLDGKRSPEEAVEGIDFNFDKIEGDDDLFAYINTVSEVFREETIKAKGGLDVKPDVILFKQANDVADMLGDDSNLFLQRLMAKRGSVENLDADVMAARTVLTALWRRGKEMATMLRENRPGEYETIENLASAYNRHITIFANAQAAYKGMQTNVARALRAMRFTAEMKDDVLKAHFAKDPDVTVAVEHAAKMAATDSPFDGAAVARHLPSSRGMRAYNEYFINSLLSSPKTQVINAASNLINTMGFQPMERMIAGATTFNRSLFMEGADQYVGMLSAAWDSLRLAGKVAKVGDNVLDPVNSPIEIRRVIDPDTLELMDATPRAITWGLGNYIRLPSRLMMTQDEFFKQMTYRGRVYAKARAEARSLGLTGQQAADLIHTRLKTAVGDAGQALDKEALQYSREATFTQDLGYGISQTLQNAAAKHPGLRLIVPFVRTPTNIFRFVWQRTPGLNWFQRQWKEEFKAGGTRRAMALSKLYTGAALWGTGLSLAFSGQITGGGPTNPEMRQRLLETGWQPYSLVVRKDDGSVGYIQYNRLDPTGMFLGLAADIAEIGGELDEATASELAIGATMALVQNLSSKTYAQGIIDAVKAIADIDRYGERYVYRMLGANVPNAMKHLNDDPYMREVRSFVDAFRSRVQGYSLRSDPRRNYFGEPVPTAAAFGPNWLSPFAWSEFKNDTVLTELYRLAELHRTEFSPPPEKFPNTNVDLTKYRSPVTGYSAYDRYHELINTVTDPEGFTFKQRLEALMSSGMWEQLTDGTGDYDGSKLKVIRQLQGAYRKLAQIELLRESPELAKAVMDSLRTKQGVQVYGREWFDEEIKPNVETETERMIREIIPKIGLLPDQQ